MNSFSIVAVIAIGCLVSTSMVRGDFAIVLNSPPDTIPFDEPFGRDTQINILPGSVARLGEIISLGDQDSPAENTELNLLGGSAWAVHAWSSSQVNVVEGSLSSVSLISQRGSTSSGSMTGGFVRSWALFANTYLEMSGGNAGRISTAGLTDGPSPDSSRFVMSGGEVDSLDATGDVLIRGGAVNRFVFHGGGRVTVTGGSIGNDFEVGSIVVGAIPGEPHRVDVVGRSGTVAVRGGSIGRGMTLHSGRTLDYSGGSIGEGFQALDDSRVVIRGTHFVIDGIDISLPLGEELEITQRDVVLEGILADQQSFRFDLNSELGHGDYFSPASTLFVQIIPEPRTTALAGAFVLAFASMNRIRCEVRWRAC